MRRYAAWMLTLTICAGLIGGCWGKTDGEEEPEAEGKES